jgi:tripartite-type tricarboxylate transporter receptor subunit TctC
MTWEESMVTLAALTRRSIAACIAIVLATHALPAAAQESDQVFFAGKTVRLIVGFGPGGGYDSYARMLAPYLSRTLNATVIVENRPSSSATPPGSMSRK